MQRAETIFTLGLFAGAVVLLINVLTTLNIGWASRGPGDGFVPFWCLMGVLSCSLVVVIQSLWKEARSNSDAKPFIQKEGLASVTKVFLPIAWAFLLLNYIGFYLTAVVYMGFFMRWIGKHNWLLVIGVSILFPVAIYFVIEKKFFIILPKGYLGEVFPFF